VPRIFRTAHAENLLLLVFSGFSVFMLKTVVIESLKSLGFRICKKVYFSKVASLKNTYLFQKLLIESLQMVVHGLVGSCHRMKAKHSQNVDFKGGLLKVFSG
jgi:hypothetical protein